MSMSLQWASHLSVGSITASYGMPRAIYYRYMKCVGVVRLDVAMLDVGLPASCLIASRGSPTLCVKSFDVGLLGVTSICACLSNAVH